MIMRKNRMDFLYKTIISEFGKKYVQKIEIPETIKTNLNSNFQLRPYQIEAFQRFLCFFEDEPFESKQPKPYQLMFNMATGSGKTLIMAGLILYLYSKGYRKFLFFVNSKNIINKTIDNFINTNSSKYLFGNNITFENKIVSIRKVDNFEDANLNDVNICFTTIHKLHGDIYIEKENSLTIEDFKQHKIVFISDEAHHINKNTRSQMTIAQLSKPNWENTVDNIFNQNYENLLLEFTATLDYEHQNIVEKYKPKVLFRYDLRQFKDDGYSKDVNLLRSEMTDDERIIQAIILNQYKQDIALKYSINLKPVILFKAQKLIKDSLENKANFHRIIENLTEKDIRNIKEKSKIKIIQKAFDFYESNTINKLIQKLKINFAETNCISVNEENLEKKSLRKNDLAELVEQQFVLNSLEDNNNPIRAIFAVNKLNEGWDVLNLFDIVRLYKTRDSKAGKPGKTTTAEAQLIGRGARYFPFRIINDQDRFKRKYDIPNNINELKIIEELHYHTIEDSKYISELTKALIDTGIYDDEKDFVERKLKLKEKFKNTELYKKGVVFENKKVKNKYENIRSFEDLGVKKRNIEFVLSSGEGAVTEAFNTNEVKSVVSNKKSKDIKLEQIPIHIIKNALSKNDFFHFSNIKHYFPSINSISDLIQQQGYLRSLEITFRGTKDRILNITNSDYFFAVIKLLNDIEKDIRNNLYDYFGTSDFKEVSSIKDKFPELIKLKIAKNNERAKSQAAFLVDEEWYAYNDNFGTSEEKQFVEMFARRFDKIAKVYTDIYLIRNERKVKIFDKKGRRFEPDF
ncbi:MAG: DEAD/DEAH box helicase family protein, partial [FCB group bacterium]|nr:DEAD/DEAH box helicase family protein [FCB group bacterium]